MISDGNQSAGSLNRSCGEMPSASANRSTVRSVGDISPRSSIPTTFRLRPAACASFSCVSFANLRWLRRLDGKHSERLRATTP